MQETRVQDLSQEDPLEEEMATHSSILTWRIPWTEEPGGLPLGDLSNPGIEPASFTSPALAGGFFTTSTT